MLGRSGNGRKQLKQKVLRMKFSIVGNVPTPRESIFKLSSASQLPYDAKFEKSRFFFYRFNYFSYFPPCWRPLFIIIRITTIHCRSCFLRTYVYLSYTHGHRPSSLPKRALHRVCCEAYLHCHLLRRCLLSKWQ